MLGPLYFFNELRIRLGFRNAIHIYYQLIIKKNCNLKIGFLKHPFSLRKGNYSDLATLKEVLIRKEYEIDISFEPRRIIDGGANIGLTSIFFANKYPNADIISIEPDTDNFHLLQKNTSVYEKVKPENSAIWNRKAFLKVVDNGWGTDGYNVVEVPADENLSLIATSVTEIMIKNNWDEIDILKLDVEGSEKEIFSNGYEFWLPKTKVLIVETHDRFKKGCSRAVFTALSKYDFSCGIKGFNMIFYNEEFNIH